MKGRLVFILSLVLLVSCSPQTYKALVNGEEQLSFEWEAKGCYGKCPQYTAVIRNGQLLFSGSRFTRFEGDTIIANFEDSEAALVEKLIQIDFLSLDSLYTLGGSSYDGPSFSYQLSTSDSDKPGVFIGQKKIETFGGEPDSLNSLNNWLNRKLAEVGLL